MARCPQKLLNVSEPTGNEGSDPPPSEDDLTAERTSREAAEERRNQAAHRYERAAERGRSRRGHKRRRRLRQETYASVARRLDRLPMDKALEASVGLAVMGSVLGLGSVHPPVITLVALVSTLALALALWLRDARSPAIVGPALVCWGLAAWCLVQLVPLPIGWLEAIAPTNADIWQRALLPLGEAGPARASISLDPGATMIEAARWFSYGALFVAAAEVAHRRGARFIVGLVFTTAVVTALVTLGHGLSGMTKVYGLYEPSFKANVWHVGPLLNANNLAGLLNLGALSGLGLMLSMDKHGSPWPVVTGVALIVGVGVISASRGGVALLLFGVVVLAITAELRHKRSVHGPPVGRARLMVAATLALGVALALLGGRAAIWNELLDENMEKLRHVGLVEPAVADFPVLGMGRGSFESVFPAYQSGRGGVVYTHAENFVAQWVLEWGAPVAIVALLALGYFLRPKRMGVRRSALAAAAWLGVMVVLLQNLVDLGLEIPGLCIAVAVTLGALWGDPDLYRPASRRPISRARSLKLAAAAVVIGVSASATAFALGRHPVAADRLALRAQLIARQPGRSQQEIAALHDGLRAAMRRHPAEPFFALLGAELAWEERTGGAIPWLQRALERSAVNGRAHLLLARVLRRHGAKNQALLELRLAAESEAALVGRAARDAAAWTQDVAELERAAPKNEDAGLFWESVAHHIRDRSVGAVCDERALALDASRVAPRARLVQDLVAKRTAGEGCTGDDEPACAREIAQHAEIAEAHAPNVSLAARMQASWLVAVGRPAEAEKLLAEVCEAATDAVPCLRARAETAARIADSEPFGEAAKALRRAACAKRDECAAINTWLGDQHMARKEHALAVTSFEKAVREHLTSERLERLANAATEAGLSSRALRALERLIERTPDQAEKAKLEARRRELMSRMVR